MNKTITEIAAILHAEGCSCVICNNDNITLCHKRGVADLLWFVQNNSSILSGAIIADKVIGKGAAALMILGGVKSIYADVISEPALELLSTVPVEVHFRERVPNIINRAGTGVCPVETLCKNCSSAQECLPLIQNFVNSFVK